MKIVIKISGSLINKEELKELAHDIKELLQEEYSIIIVHGGGKEITKFLKKLGITTSFIDGLRITPREAIEVIEMVLSGSINKRIVKIFNNEGIKAVGISGVDCSLISAEMMDERKFGYVGKIKNIRKEFLMDILSSGYLPVITPIGKDRIGNSLNINADIVAGKIAETINAEHLLFFSDVQGVINGKNKVVRYIEYTEIPHVISSGFVQNGMIPKLNSAYSALAGGVKWIHILKWEGRGTLLKQLKNLCYGTIMSAKKLFKTGQKF